MTLYASSCILADLHAHATITIDDRRRARRRLDMQQPMSLQVSRRLQLSTNSVAGLTKRRARHALSGFPRLTSPRDCFFKVAPRRLARASRNTHTTHTHTAITYIRARSVSKSKLLSLFNDSSFPLISPDYVVCLFVTKTLAPSLGL